MECIRRHLTNNVFQNDLFKDILMLENTDLNIVARDGIYRTQKLLVWAAFPSLHNCLAETFNCFGGVTVIVPEESVDNIQRATNKTFLEGDPSKLECIFGLNKSVNNHLHKHLIKEREKRDAKECDKDPLEIDQNVYIKEEVHCPDDDNENSVNLPPPKKRQKRDNGFVCGLCGKVFRDTSNLKRHQELGHKTMTCKKCNGTFEGHEVFQNHRKNCWFKCTICDWITKCLTKECVNGHRRRHAKEGEICTFVSQQIQEDEIKDYRKRYNENWNNKERQYEERITYVHK